MGRGSTSLDSRAYDDWLAENKKTKEIRERQNAKRNANKGYTGWHFGIGDTPVHTKNKEEFKRELEKRGLLMRDDVRRSLR